MWCYQKKETLFYQKKSMNSSNYSQKFPYIFFPLIEMFYLLYFMFMQTKSLKKTDKAKHLKSKCFS